MQTILGSLAVVTGASSGIGLELARLCAHNNFDLIIAADRPLDAAISQLSTSGRTIKAVQVDLSTQEGVDVLYAALEGRPVDALFANAGHGLGKGFLDEDFAAAKHVIDTNITGTTYLIHKIGRDMRARQRPHTYYRVDCGPHAGNLSSGIQRHESFYRFVLLGLAK